MDTSERKRIESKSDVEAYLVRLKYALADQHTHLELVRNRASDRGKHPGYTNWYTLGVLFSKEDLSGALRRELSNLTTGDYIETVKDLDYPSRSEMRIFSKTYSEGTVYIKIRVEMFGKTVSAGSGYVLVLSYHFAQWDFDKTDFPYGSD